MLTERYIRRVSADEDVHKSQLGGATAFRTSNRGEGQFKNDGSAIRDFE